MSPQGGSAAVRLGSDSLVSAIVCSYNQGRYLEAAVGSLAAQTHQRIELRLVDDASTDASRALLADLARRYRRRFAAIRTILRDRNSGKLACLNMTLDRVGGDLAVILDADDLLSPTYVEESIDALRAHRGRDRSVAFVYTDCELIDAEGRRLGIGRSVSWDRELLERWSYIPDCGLTLTAALRAAIPFDESIRVGTKHHKWLRLSEAGWSGRHVGRPLFSYRLHADNVSGIGARLLPELNGHGASERLLAREWPTATPPRTQPAGG